MSGENLAWLHTGCSWKYEVVLHHKGRHQVEVIVAVSIAVLIDRYPKDCNRKDGRAHLAMRTFAYRAGSRSEIMASQDV